MKFTKSVSDISKKTKTAVTNKSKFKNKDGAASNGKLQKGIMHAANLLTKGSFDNEVGTFVKSSNKPNKGAFSKKQEKKKDPPPGKLSPEVQLGLKLDKMLEKKSQKTKARNPDITPTKSGKNNEESNNLDISSSESPTKSRRRRRKGKNKLNVSKTETSIEGSPASEVNTNDSVEKVSSQSPTKKKAKKRKGQSAVHNSKSVGTSEQVLSPEEPLPAKKNKSKKIKVKGTESVGIEENITNKISISAMDDATYDTTDFTLNSNNVLKAVKSALDLYKKNSKSNKLLGSEPEPIFLKFLFFHLHNKKKIVRFDLSNSLVSSTSDICLFVSDTAKKNADDSKSQWEQVLREENVTNITEVIPLRSLITDYKQFQDKRKLSDRFDFFLVDAKIAHRVFGLLGSKFFHSRRKTPTPVALKNSKMSENINKALSKSVAQYTPAAEAFSIQVGHTGMKESLIQENVLKLWEQYPQQFGVYWENIKRASLLVNNVPELPIFCCVQPPEGSKLRVFKNMKWSKDSNIPVIGELSTALDKKVLVYPSGQVIVKETRKIEKSEESIQAKRLKQKEKKKLKKLNKKKKGAEEKDSEDDGDDELDSDDDLGGRVDMLESDSDEELEFEESSSEEEQPKKKPKGNVEINNVNKGKGKKKNISYEEENEDSDVVDKAEEMYLQDLAVEKSKVKKTKKEAKQKQTAEELSLDNDSNDTDSESDEDTSGLGRAWHDDDEEQSIDDSEDEEIPNLVPAGKMGKNKKTGNIKGGKKVNGVKQQAAGKSQMKKAQKKSGAIKNSPSNKPNNKRPSNLQTSSEVQGASSKKKTSGPSFQGVRADQTKPKQKKKDNKNKLIAKKLAK